jgi:hypothetical protein
MFIPSQHDYKGAVIIDEIVIHKAVCSIIASSSLDAITLESSSLARVFLFFLEGQSKSVYMLPWQVLPVKAVKGARPLYIQVIDLLLSASGPGIPSR